MKITRAKKKKTNKSTDYGLILLSNNEKLNHAIKTEHPHARITRLSVDESQGYLSGKEIGKNIGFSPQLSKDTKFLKGR